MIEIDLLTLMSQVSTRDIITFGAVASSIIAITTLGKQLWAVCLWVLSLAWRVVFALILVPLGHILMWLIDGSVDLYDVIKTRLGRVDTSLLD